MGVESGIKKKGRKHPSIKQQIRGVERLLKREGITEEVKKQHEAKLKELHAKSEGVKQRELEIKYSKKYHMVRFFERKNISRAIKKAKKELEEMPAVTTPHYSEPPQVTLRVEIFSTVASASAHNLSPFSHPNPKSLRQPPPKRHDKASKCRPEPREFDPQGGKERKECLKRISDLEEDLEYVQHFPRDRKYVSVLKTEDKDRVDEMRAIIKARIADKTAQELEQQMKEAMGSEDEADEVNPKP